MRRHLLLVLALGLLLTASTRAAAQPAPQDLIARAVQAHGGEEKLTRFSAGQSRNKGTLEVQGLSLPFTQDVVYQLPNKFREHLELDVQGQKVTVTTVYNGEKGWLNNNGQVKELDGQLLTEIQEVAYLMRASRLTALLKDARAYELTPLGEAKVNARPAVGLKVASKGHRDLNLFFDKESGLMVKVERRAVDVGSGQEVTEERIVSEYQEYEGVKTPKKVQVRRDGKKIMEAEIVEIKLLEKADDSSFAKP